MRRLKDTLILVLLSLVLTSGWLPAAGLPPNNILEQVNSLLEQGDSAQALAVLDADLKTDKKHWAARLARGQLYLALGEYGRAREDFNACTFADSPPIRYRGEIGLGDIDAARINRKPQAILWYRKAIHNCPDSAEAYYKLALAGIAMGTGEGVERGADALIDLLCLDPTYRDANLIWRDSIKIHSIGGFRRLAEGMEKYLISHDGPVSLLLDAASYHFQGDQPERALPLLDRLAGSLPDFKPETRHLVRARCLAEIGDTASFQTAYDSALVCAEMSGEFNELISHASTIFHPEEQRTADSLQTAGQWARFFRVFWSRRDPDPLTTVNERLFEHYRRLREAQRKYPIPNPYVRAMKSPDSARLLNLQTIRASEIDGVLGYDYDPDLLWKRNGDLLLEQRGLLLIRHGIPDEIRIPPAPTDEKGRGRGPIPNEEVWRYGGYFFPFRLQDLTGGQYQYLPLPVRGIGNITKAMDTESYKDLLPALETECCLVYFMAPDGKIELEAYQSAMVKESEMTSPPGVDLAVFDLSWKELARSGSVAVQANIPGGTQWIGASRVDVAPGKMFYAARMDITGKRAVQRKPVTAEAYAGRGIELSGIVLGSPVSPTGGTHSRLGVELLPRPSLTFSSGEAITVYLEVYGLSRGAGGGRDYTVSVTITRKSSDPGVFGKVKRLVTLGGEERRSSLTLSFDRQPTVSTPAVPETFQVDTSVLLPGEYELGIAVADRNSRNSRKTAFGFKLIEPE